MTTLIRGREIVAQPSPPDLELGPADDPAAFAAELSAARVVAVRFPSFVDGRGYSLGRLVRERHGFRGELRAVGAIACDHLQALERCGFDAFELRPGEDPATALAAFSGLSEAYQATAVEPLPLFRRRAA